MAKKAIGIVFMLTIVVMIASVAVFYVESITTPEIIKRQKAEAIAAQKEVFPEVTTDDTLETFTTEDKDFGDTGIQEVTVITDSSGAEKGYIYISTFQGFSSTIKYIIGVNADDIITGYQTLEQGDTPGYGAQIADEVNWTQFPGMAFEDAGTGNFDGLTGATITTGSWKGSFEKLYAYHEEEFGGVIPLTPEQILAQQKQSIVPEGTTISAYTNTLAFAEYGITNIEVANDGTSDVAVLYTVEFVGYTPTGHNTYIISYDLTTHNVIGGLGLSSDDTSGIGARIVGPGEWDDFPGKTPADLLAGSIDGLSGATITTDAWKSSLQNVTIYHQAEFQGIVVLTPEQQFDAYKQELFPTATTFTDVTAEKPASSIVTGIYDAYDESDNYLGVVYHITTIGASYSELTTVEFLVGIDADNEFTGFRMFADNETPGKADAFYEEDYDASLVGDAIDGEYGIDAVTGSTVTYDRISAAINDVVVFHTEKYYDRPDSLTADNAELLLAFPTAASFESVYEDYPFTAGIGNIYAAKDGSGTVLGYVYYGTLDKGFSDAFEFTWGVDTTGTTVELNVFEGTDSWGAAADSEWSSYTGPDRDFPTSSWIDNWEGVTFASLLATEVDDVAGVSTTTSAFRTVLEAIAQYHIDNSVGGAS